MKTGAERVLEEIVRGWNQKDWEILESVHASNWVDRSAPDGMNDLNSMKDFFNSFTGSFPDMTMEVLKSIVNDDEVAYFYRIKGTQESVFMGIPAKGQQVDFSGMMMLKIVDGECAEAWGVTDKMLLFHQLRKTP